MKSFCLKYADDEPDLLDLTMFADLSSSALLDITLCSQNEEEGACMEDDESSLSDFYE